MGTIENLYFLAFAVVAGLEEGDPERTEWRRWAEQKAVRRVYGLPGRTLGNFIDQETGQLSVEVARKRARRRP